MEGEPGILAAVAPGALLIEYGVALPATPLVRDQMQRLRAIKAAVARITRRCSGCSGLEPRRLLGPRSRVAG
jgi:hypothetical protein